MTYAYARHSNIIGEDPQEIRRNSNFYDGYIKEYLPNARDNECCPTRFRT